MCCDVDEAPLDGWQGVLTDSAGLRAAEWDLAQDGEGKRTWQRLCCVLHMFGPAPRLNSHLLIYSAADAPGDAADEEVAAVPSLFWFLSYLFSPELKVNSTQCLCSFFNQHRNLRSNFNSAFPQSP